MMTGALPVASREAASGMMTGVGDDDRGWGR
jgi:hypothetical protein